MSIHPDFPHREILLQLYCSKLDATSDRAPVAHCEITSNGIEFDWDFQRLFTALSHKMRKEIKTSCKAWLDQF